jgi:hypothetical protein
MSILNQARPPPLKDETPADQSEGFYLTLAQPTEPNRFSKPLATCRSGSWLGPWEEHKRAACYPLRVRQVNSNMLAEDQLPSGVTWPDQDPPATDVINVPCAGGSPAYLEIDKLAMGYTAPPWARCSVSGGVPDAGPRSADPVGQMRWRAAGPSMT